MKKFVELYDLVLLFFSYLKIMYYFRIIFVLCENCEWKYKFIVLLWKLFMEYVINCLILYKCYLWVYNYLCEVLEINRYILYKNKNEWFINIFVYFKCYCRNKVYEN